MIIVIASIYDIRAKQFVDNYLAVGDIKLLTAIDFACIGWNSGFGNVIIDETFCIQRQKYNENEITSIINFLPAITQNELPFINEDDREYVAQEMNAFLLAWLYKLNKKVINQPTASSLIGIQYRPVTWLLKISEFGFTVKKSYFDTMTQNIQFVNSNSKIYIIGKDIFGTKDNNMRTKLKKFVQKYNIPLVTIEYEQKTQVIHAIYQTVDIGIPYIQEALFKMCQKREIL
jgi:hypothetical protein